MKLSKRVVAAALLTGSLVAGGSAGAAQAAGHHPLRGGQHVAQTRQSAARLLKVTAVNGSTITAVGARGTTVTVTVMAATTYQEMGQAAALTGVQPGDYILAQGTSTGTDTFNATMIRIVMPGAAGTVMSLNGTSSFSLATRNGRTVTVNVSASTKYLMAGQAAALSAITQGMAVVVHGTVATDGSVTATDVRIAVPAIVGKVTASNGGTLTVQGRFGTTYTVTTVSTTTYAQVTRAAAGSQTKRSTLTPTTATAVTVGSRIVAQGTLSTDGKTMTAQRIIALGAAASQAQTQ